MCLSVMNEYIFSKIDFKRMGEFSLALLFSSTYRLALIRHDFVWEKSGTTRKCGQAHACNGKCGKFYTNPLSRA